MRVFLILAVIGYQVGIAAHFGWHEARHSDTAVLAQGLALIAMILALTFRDDKP